MKKYQTWLQSKTMLARDMAASELSNYGNMAGDIKQHKQKKRIILTYKKISKNVIKT